MAFAAFSRLFVLIKAIAFVLHVEIVFSHSVQSTKRYRRSTLSVRLLHSGKVNCFYLMGTPMMGWCTHFYTFYYGTPYFSLSLRSALARYMHVQSSRPLFGRDLYEKMTLVGHQQWLTYVLFFCTVTLYASSFDMVAHKHRHS